jgi:hypothetical protein
MITDLNRFIIAVCQKIEKAEKFAQFPVYESDRQYNNGYYQGLKDAWELAVKIHNGTDGY